MNIIPHLRKRDIISYGILAAPLAFASMPLYVHAPDYYATRYGASLTTLAIILFCLRLVDAVQDPLIGYASDRLSKWRNVIIAASAILLIIGFSALFQPPSPEISLIWFIIFMLLATTAFSILSINLNTIGGLWSRDKYQKTRIASCREAFGLVGLLTAVILPSILMQSMPAPKAFAIVSVVLATLMLAALITFLFWYKRTSLPVTKDNTALKPERNISPATKKFFAAYAVSMLASSIPAILVLFYIRDRLQSEAYTGLFLALYFLSGAFAMPLWQILSKRSNKYTAWIIGMTMAVISFAWALFLTPETAWSYGIICVLSGIALGSDLALPPSILADHIHDYKQEDNASYLYSLLNFLAKSSLAIGSAITLPLLDIWGYTPGQINTPSALLALSICYAGIPCIIKITAVLMLWRSMATFQSGETNVENIGINNPGHHSHSGSNLNV